MKIKIYGKLTKPFGTIMIENHQYLSICKRTKQNILKAPKKCFKLNLMNLKRNINQVLTLALEKSMLELERALMKQRKRNYIMKRTLRSMYFS